MTHRNRSRIGFLLPLLAAILTLAGCAGGPDMGGLSPADFYARYSGSWIPDDNAGARIREAMEARRAGNRPGMMPGRTPADPGAAGGLGGMGGRPAGGRGRGGGAEMDPAQIRAAMDMARRAPARLSLTVNDSMVTVVGLHRSALVLPLGKKVDVAGAEDMTAKAKWDGAVLVVERNIGRMGVEDRFEPLPEEHRLLVTRKIVFGPTDGIQATFACTRDGQS